MPFDLFNTGMAALLSAAAGLAVMHPQIRCGFLAHVGLVFVSLGFLAVFLMGLQGSADHDALAVAHAMVHVGLLLCGAGYWRQFRRRGHQRRASDWIDPRNRGPV